MLGLGCLLLCAAVFLFHFSGLKLVPLLLAKYNRSPLVVSSYFQNKQRSGNKVIRVIVSEPEAKSVFYNLGKRFLGGKLRRKWKGVHSRLGMNVMESLSFTSHQKLRKYVF